MKIVDLNGNIINDEIKTFRQTVGINLQKSTKSFTEYITKNICQEMGESTDKDKIIEFINTYNIHWQKAIKCKNAKTIEECVKKFKTLNDFFIRKIPIKIQNKSSKSFCSPADSRTFYMYNQKFAKKAWIKGRNYCIKCMLQVEKNKTISDYYNKSHILISRLAPVDYHRFHSPVDGIFLGLYDIPGEYLSVDPILINSHVDVFTRNYRGVYYILSKYFGVVAICVVGATCVGSIKMHNHKIGYTITKGEELGYFNFGGSTIVTVIPYNDDMEIISQLADNSRKKIETYVNVGDTLIHSKKQKNFEDDIKKEFLTMISTNKK